MGKMEFHRDKHLAKVVPTMLICVILVDLTVYKLKIRLRRKPSKKFQSWGENEGGGPMTFYCLLLKIHVASSNKESLRLNPFPVHDAGPIGDFL